MSSNALELEREGGGESRDKICQVPHARQLAGSQGRRKKLHISEGQLYIGKGSRSECSKGDKFIECARKSVWEYLIDRLMEVTEGKVSEEQGGFRKGKVCVDQIVAMKRLVEEYYGKDKKLYAAFMDLKKAYNRDDREALECAKNLWCGRTAVKRYTDFL